MDNYDKLTAAEATKITIESEAMDRDGLKALSKDVYITSLLGYNKAYYFWDLTDADKAELERRGFTVECSEGYVEVIWGDK